MLAKELGFDPRVALLRLATVRGLLVPGLAALCALLLPGCNGVWRSSSADRVPAIPAVTDVVVHSRLSSRVVLNPVPAGVQGDKGLGWARAGDLALAPAQRPQNEELSVPAGEPLDLFLILINQIGRSRTFLVTAFLDYEQVPFEVDGTSGILHEVTVPSPAEINLPLRLKANGTGAHDLILVAFADLYDHPLDPRQRESDQGSIIGRRAVIVVGDRNQPVRSLTPVAFGREAPPKLPLVPIRLGFANAPKGQMSHPSERYITFAQAPPGQGFAYQIWATNFGNDQADTFNYALVGFLDFHQIDLVQPLVTVAQVGPGQEVVLDARVDVPNSPSIHELQVVYVFDPYKSVLRKEVVMPFVFSSPRLGLDAR